MGRKKLADVLIECPDIPQLFIAPATIDLSGVFMELLNSDDMTMRLYQALVTFFSENPLPDVVFIDCPPSVDLPTVNSLVAADEVLIPLQAEYYSLEGLQQLRNSLTRIRESLNPELEVAGIVVTMFDGRNNLSKDVYNEVKKVFPDLVFDQVIPRSVRAAEAPSAQKTVITTAPDSSVALAYQCVAYELMDRAHDKSQHSTNDNKDLETTGRDSAVSEDSSEVGHTFFTER